MTVLSGLRRRAFLSNLLVGIPALAAAQTGIVEKGKAVICDGSSVKCPLGHESCREIDAPIAVGNGNFEYPEVGQLHAFKMLRCQVCGVLFSEKQ